MEIALVFPPPFDLTQPYLSLPMLSSFLKQHGHSVTQHDLNVGFYNYILAPAAMQEYASTLDKKYFSIPRRLASAALENRKAAKVARSLIETEPDIGMYFRDPASFYDPALYSKGIHLLTRSCDVVSATYSPTKLTPISFRMRYQTSSIAQLIEATGDMSENPFIDPFNEVFAAEILNSNPKVIGLSVVFSDQLIAAFTLARCLKARSPETKIIVGGDVLSKLVRHRPQGISNLFFAIDAIVADDGRAPLLEICDRIADGRSLDGIDRVVTSTSCEGIPARPLPIAKLEEFGFPDYAGTRSAKYFSPGSLYSMLIGKGCAWGRCVFCSESYTKAYEAKSIKFAVEEIAHLVSEYGVSCINFADSDVAPPMLRTLAASILERGLSVAWSCRARLDPRIDDALCSLLYASGCRKIYFGLESASPRVLKLMRKGTNPKRAPLVLEACGRNGIATHLFSFVGFPGETEEDVQLTGNFFVDNIAHISSFNIGAFCFREDTDVFLYGDHYGVSSSLAETIDGDFDDHPYVVSQGITMEQAQTIAPELARNVFARIEKLSPTYHMFRSSSTVNKKGVPTWDSHNLAYIAKYSHGWSATQPASRTIGNDRLRAGFVTLDDTNRSKVLVYVPTTGKIHGISKRALELLNNATEESCSHMEADSTSAMYRQFLATALAEGLLQKVSNASCQ